MSKLSSSEKRHKQSLKKRTRNRHIRATVKTAVKDVRTALEEKNIEKAGETLAAASSVIAKAGSKGVLHKKTVSRKISRLSRATHKASSAK